MTTKPEVSGVLDDAQKELLKLSCDLYLKAYKEGRKALRADGFIHVNQLDGMVEDIGMAIMKPTEPDYIHIRRAKAAIAAIKKKVGQ